MHLKEILQLQKQNKVFAADTAKILYSQKANCFISKRPIQQHKTRSNGTTHCQYRSNANFFRKRRWMHQTKSYCRQRSNRSIDQKKICSAIPINFRNKTKYNSVVITKSNRKFEDYSYFDCVVKSCPNKLKLIHATQNKFSKNEHNHTAKEGKNAAAVICFKLRLKDIATDKVFAEVTPKNLMVQAMTTMGDVTFPPGFEKKAYKVIRIQRFRSRYV